MEAGEKERGATGGARRDWRRQASRAMWFGVLRLQLKKVGDEKIEKGEFSQSFALVFSICFSSLTGQEHGE